MTYLTNKLLGALAAAALTGAALATAALPATAAAVTAQSGALFDGFGKGLDEDSAAAGAESAAQQNALDHGFTECSVFESVLSQDGRSGVWFAIVTVRCEDAA
ncbi:hypothetical protein MF672_016900 [Actinomadura sp. ATCC 31491]|uniref:DUF732 domain-containing protein n=1 Tax=Actinomadura luzonensis TaxID=2805427 RepID=A0ABT0FSZ7_9ACTN|nr:hypothetical protein [Actinomadura luzonensis]MCK2215455.1 hypothetical protein [Actinomadura luzonensis]